MSPSLGDAGGREVWYTLLVLAWNTGVRNQIIRVVIQPDRTETALTRYSHSPHYGLAQGMQRLGEKTSITRMDGEEGLGLG